MQTEDVKPILDVDQLAAAIKDPAHLRWANFYLKRLNKTQASRDLGIAEPSASNYGVKCYNRPEVKAYIEYVLEQEIGVPDDNLRILRSMADTDLKQYMTERVLPQQDWIERPLKHLLQELEIDLEAEQEYECMYAETKLDVSQSKKRQKELSLEIVKLKTEIRKRGPLAKRIVLGETYLVKKQVLDLNKICADHENGKIKKYKETKDGIEVELYDAKDAAIQLLKIAGKYANEAPVTNFNFDNADVTFE